MAVTNHYYIHDFACSSCKEQIKRWMGDRVARSGSQMIHYHKHRDECAGNIHEIVDVDGVHRVEDVRGI